MYLSIYLFIYLHIYIYLCICLSLYVCMYLSIYGSTVLLLQLRRVFSFLILCKVGSTPWTGDQPVARPLPTCRTTQTRNRRTQTSMPAVGFDPTITAFERAETIPALDDAATVIGTTNHWPDTRRTLTAFSLLLIRCVTSQHNACVVFVRHGFDTWSLTWREVRRLRVLQNTVKYLHPEGASNSGLKKISWWGASVWSVQGRFRAGQVGKEERIQNSDQKS
jgi:hypothetical protein